MLTFVLIVAIKFVAILAIGWLLQSWFSRSFLGVGRTDLARAMHDHVANQENLSPVIVLGGLLLAVAQIIAFPRVTTLALYTYDVLTKGSLGLFIGMMFALFEARRIGVKSVSNFAEFFHDPSNNEVVAYIMLVLNVAVLVAMRT